VASTTRPGLGTETLQKFADLQRQVSERVAPLQDRQRRRSRQRVRRIAVRLVAMLVPLLLVALFALDVGGGRTWVGHRWDDLTRSSTGGQQGRTAPGY
jgi:hypothetical protein